MKIVVGLGNPGPEYAFTRHNAGMVLADKLTERIPSDYGWRRQKEVMVYESRGWVLVKSAGIFMNDSGRMVREAIKNREGELYVAHDDLDIRLGEYKIQMGKGPKVHGGINSIEQTLGTEQFWRIRIGIDNRIMPVEGEEYVLQKFGGEEKVILDGVLDKIADEILKAAD